jgi:hypothetical protein
LVSVENDLILCIGKSFCGPAPGRIAAESPEGQHLVGDLPMRCQILDTLRSGSQAASFFAGKRLYIYESTRDLVSGVAELAETGLFDES